MARDRFEVLLWTIALGFTTGIIVGSVVRTPAALSSIQFTLVVTVAAGLALGALLWTRWETWSALGSWLGIAVYFVALFVGSVLLGGVPGLLLADPGSLRTGVQLAGSALAFAITIWLCFYGGVGATVQWLAPRLGVEI